MLTAKKSEVLNHVLISRVMQLAMRHRPCSDDDKKGVKLLHAIMTLLMNAAKQKIKKGKTAPSGCALLLFKFKLNMFKSISCKKNSIYGD